MDQPKLEANKRACVATIILNSIDFTDGSDTIDGSLVAPPSNILVDLDGPVSTKSGNDTLIGQADDSTSFYSPGNNTIGVLVQNNLSLDDGNDKLIGIATAAAARGFVYGIAAGWVEGVNCVINLGKGNDTARGIAYSSSGESDNVGGISLFAGCDIDTGEGGPGIKNRGNDNVYGEAGGLSVGSMWGIYLDEGSEIRTNEGNDSVTGIAIAENNAFVYGINFYDSSSKIITGSGNDRVTAYASNNNGLIADGFAGNGVVDLGADNDILEGFGSLTAHGGTGKDTWILSNYNSTEFTISKGNSANLEATFSTDTAVAIVDGFEVFVFANGTFNYADLV